MNKYVYRILQILPDKMYLSIQYRYLTGRRLNLKNPTRFNEKIQWLKLYDRRPEYTTYVDKYLVKKYVAQKIGEKYIIPILQVWDSADSIDFSSLPDRFVLKCNHDSKSVIICKDKNQLNQNDVRAKLNAHLKRNHFYYGREWPYKNIHPCIIAEKYMEDQNGGLQDYKVMCFNGEPKLIQVHKGRFTNQYTQDFYDINWIRQPFNQKREVNSEKPEERPIFLEEMLELSSILAKDIPQIRVDWYYADSQLFFGELTFFDASGYLDFEPDEYNDLIGSWIELPKRRR